MPKTTTPKTECACGCGADMIGRKKSIYRQGHDARHVSILVKAVAAGTKTNAEAMTDLSGRPNLQAKYQAAIERANGKTSQPKAAKPKLTPGEAQELADDDAVFRAEQVAKQAAKVPEWGDDLNHPDRVKAKIGRWEYQGRVETDPLATTGQAFIYTNKKGDEVRHTGAFTVL